MWARAYLEQARSDWETRKIVAENSCAACHELHYLQMATEKLGKAVLLRGGNPLSSVDRTHKKFTAFLRVAARHPGLQRQLGFDARQLKEYVDGVLPTADMIERLAPTLAGDGPNAEYPWLSPSGNVVAPASHDFLVLDDLQKADGRKLLALVKITLDRFDTLF